MTGVYIDMAAADIMLHLLTLPAESIHHACLWGWSLSLSFIFTPYPSRRFFFFFFFSLFERRQGEAIDEGGHISVPLIF